ncbi:MAG: PorT family protein [Bacteroidales bacterium]|nr:PorT family protein [Bacteroidales bacterium]
MVEQEMYADLDRNAAEEIVAEPVKISEEKDTDSNLPQQQEQNKKRIQTTSQSVSQFTGNTTEEKKETDYAEISENAEYSKSSGSSKYSGNSGTSNKSGHTFNPPQHNNTHTAIPHHHRTRSSHSLHLQLMASNTLSSSTSLQGLGALTPSAHPYLASDGYFAPNGPSVSSIRSAPRYDEEITNVKHRQPVRFGLIGNYPINRRWSVGVGVDYTCLVSELSAGDSRYHYQNEQTLHYLGVPMQVSYHWLQNKRFNLYTTAGTEIAFGINGKMVIDNYVNDHHASHSQRNIKNIPLQTSVQASAGIQYNLLRNVGIYVEPGVSYHFDDHSSLITLYNQKPLNFDLNVGLRVTIPSK